MSFANKVEDFTTSCTEKKKIEYSYRSHIYHLYPPADRAICRATTGDLYAFLEWLHAQDQRDLYTHTAVVNIVSSVSYEYWPCEGPVIGARTF